MGQELLNITGYTPKPRTYYLATTSNGLKFVRGSHDDRYSHAVVCSKSPYHLANQVETYGTCHGRYDLAKRTFNSYNKNIQEGWEYELVELVKVTAKEVRAIKKAQRLSEVQNNQRTETEQSNDNAI